MRVDCGRSKVSERKGKDEGRKRVTTMRFEATILAEKLLGWPFDPYARIEDAWLLVEKLRERGIDVIVGVLDKNACVELRRWRDRRAEGVPGDPHTGRSRETFV